MITFSKMIALTSAGLLVTACTGAGISIDPAKSSEFCSSLTAGGFNQASQRAQGMASGKAGAYTFKSVMTVEDKNNLVFPKPVNRTHFTLGKNVYLEIQQGGGNLYTKTKAPVIITVIDGQIICGPASLAES